MDEVWKKIYERVIYQEEDLQKAERELELEIHKLLEPYGDMFGRNELECVRSLMYATESKSLQEGVCIGIRYALRLLIFLMTKS